ncbi:MAG: response regulator [Prolixibacteraceae bacterium]|jgi:PAS domain S-box-containing protein
MKLQTKILVIEDDARLAKTIENILELHEFDVCIAPNGAIGIQKTFEYNPDLILCDINMDPIDGYQVYNVLKESSVLDQVPFIFITANSNLQDIRFGMDLGADDYFVKPFDNDGLINSIERRLSKYRKLKEIGKREFKALFKLSPNGIFMFNGDLIFDANPAMKQILGFEPDHFPTHSFENILDPKSFKAIQEKIQRCSKGILKSFHEDVSILSKNGEKQKVMLYVSVYEKYSGYSLMIGFVIPKTGKENDGEVFISDIVKVLKKENVVVTDSLGEQLTNIFKQHNLKIKAQNNEYFSDRENQVLCLSMEGLPIKLIADKLSISDRTVEKHRTKLMEKTGSGNMIEVIVFALRNNLINI